MANHQHPAILLSSVEGWNEWRRQNQEVIPDLIGAKLKGANLVHADFDGTNLTGACIQDWNVNAETKLQTVVCEYVYLSQSERQDQYMERRPIKGEFSQGELG